MGKDGGVSGETTDLNDNNKYIPKAQNPSIIATYMRLKAQYMFS